MQIRRATFQDRLDRDETFSLLHKLMRVYHDGIVLTNGKEIVFKNRLLSELLLWPFKLLAPPSLEKKVTKGEKSLTNVRKGFEDLE
jgi:hypothetical protein